MCVHLCACEAALKFCFKTCVAIKFVDDDDDDVKSLTGLYLYSYTVVCLSPLSAVFWLSAIDLHTLFFCDAAAAAADN